VPRTACDKVLTTALRHGDQGIRGDRKGPVDLLPIAEPLANHRRFVGIVQAGSIGRHAEQRVRPVERRDVELVVKGHMLDLWIAIPHCDQFTREVIRIAQRLHCLRHCHFRALGKQLSPYLSEQQKGRRTPLLPSRDHAIPARLRHPSHLGYASACCRASEGGVAALEPCFSSH
jgi:hypothetical protein